jgi:energy-coupling factor transporter transmembrane protein EcfT
MGISIVIGFITNPKIGMAGFAACAGTLIFATTFIEHIILVSWIGLGIFLLIIGFILWKTYSQQKSMGKKDKAIEETVATTELAKTMLSKENRDNLFGKDGERGLAGRIQNEDTVSIVSENRKKISKIWEIVKEN